MIRTPPQHNTENPPGQVKYNFERPLGHLINEYTSETHQKALQEAFETGKVVGYHDGYLAARRRYAPQSFPDYDNSEAAR